MSNELSTEVSPEIISSILLIGDISKLTPNQKSVYYAGICKTLSLNPLTQPFAIIKFQGKETLYARAGCTQQIADIRKINTEVLKKEKMDGVYIVTVRATLPDGRFTDDDGITSLIEPDKIKQGDNWINNPRAGQGLRGNDLANALMKATTKAKRRAVLALCGLGLPDESELETMERQPSVQSSDKSRVEEIVEAETAQFVTTAEVEKVQEVKEDAPKEEPKPKAEEKQPDKPKKTAKKEDIKPDNKQTTGLPDTKVVVGLIDNSSQGPNVEIVCVLISKEPVMNPYTNKADIKYSFLIDGNRYGTWDTTLAKKVMDCIDNRRLVKFEYKERANHKDPNKPFNDIVSFKEAEAEKDVAI